MFLFFRLVKSCLIWEVFINPQYSADITLSYCFDVYRIILMKKKSILWEDIEGVSNNFFTRKDNISWRTELWISWKTTEDSGTKREIDYSIKLISNKFHENCLLFLLNKTQFPVNKYNLPMRFKYRALYKTFRKSKWCKASK